VLSVDKQGEAEEAKAVREEKEEVRAVPRLQEPNLGAVRPEILDQLPMRADVQQPALALHVGQLDSTLEVPPFHTAPDSFRR
jgi:hypothetical protein